MSCRRAAAGECICNRAAVCRLKKSVGRSWLEALPGHPIDYCPGIIQDFGCSFGQETNATPSCPIGQPVLHGMDLVSGVLDAENVPPLADIDYLIPRSGTEVKPVMQAPGANANVAVEDTGHLRCHFQACRKPAQSRHLPYAE